MLHRRLRLGLLFSLPVLLVLCMGGLSLYLLRDTVKRSEIMIGAQAREVLDMQRLQLAFESKSSSSRGYLLSGESEPYLSGMRSARSVFLDLLERIRLEADQPQERAYLAEIERLEAEHERINQNLIARRRTGGSGQKIAEEFTEVMQPVRKQLKDSLTALVRFEEVLLEQNRSEFTRRVRYLESLIVVLSVVGALMVLGTALLLDGMNREKRLRVEVEHALEQLEKSRSQLRELTRRLHQAQEEERVRIGREIHDELGQSLTVLKMQVHQLKSTVSEGKQQQILSEMSDSISRIVQGVRSVAAELRPAILEDAGLGAGIENLVGEFRRQTGGQVRLTLDLPDDHANRYSAEMNTAAYRILQEALTNAVRHAEAKVVDVIVQESEGNLELMLRDYGRKRPDSYEAHNKSTGVVGMRERTESLGGDFSISYVPGQGTVVRAQFPLHNLHKELRT